MHPSIVFHTLDCTRFQDTREPVSRILVSFRHIFGSTMIQRPPANQLDKVSDTAKSIGLGFSNTIDRTSVSGIRLRARILDESRACRFVLSTVSFVRDCALRLDGIFFRIVSERPERIVDREI